GPGGTGLHLRGRDLLPSKALLHIEAAVPLRLQPIRDIFRDRRARDAQCPGERGLGLHPISLARPRCPTHACPRARSSSGAAPIGSPAPECLSVSWRPLCGAPCSFSARLGPSCCSACIIV